MILIPRKACWPIGRRAGRLLLLTWLATSLGCHAGTVIEDRTVLAMAGVVQFYQDQNASTLLLLKAEMEPIGNPFGPSPPKPLLLPLASPSIPLYLAGEVRTEEELAPTLAQAPPRHENGPAIPALTACLPGEPENLTLCQPARIIDLAGALRLAGVDNPTIALAEETVRTNQAELTLARALLFPSLNVGTTLALHQGNLLSSQGVMRRSGA